ncbi:MAG: hypothetical protein SGJ09_04285 [Phycisphaerae bacterium]|nr:hypothetical protein [Phycisphaerae bacterium]
MAEPQNSPPASGGVDPITGFWRDVWARSTAGAGIPGMPGMAGIPGMPGMPGMGQTGDSPFGGAAFTPDAMRRMQGAFYEAMAQYAEQYMRSPQFLESMKRSMDQAMQLRQQMDGFLKSNMSSAFESASGGSNSEILGAIRQSSAQLQSQIAKIDERLSDVELVVSGKPRASKSSAKAESKSKPKPQSKSQKKPTKR